MEHTDDTTRLSEDLNRAALRLTRRLRVTDAQSGMSAARLSVLAVLVYGGPKSITALARAEQVAQPTMSKIVGGLVKADLAQVSTHSTDARVRVVTVTKKGASVLETAKQRRLRALDALLNTLPKEQIDNLGQAAASIEHMLDAGKTPSASPAPRKHE